MNKPEEVSEESEVSPDEQQSVLFAQLIIQQSNMAMMLMGKTPHPETGQPVKQLEGARLFIDQLEMLEAKTKGNLSKEEEAFLKQTLMTLRMAFVEAVEAEPARGEKREAMPESAAAQPVSPEPEPAAAPEESHKKFSKKY